ncbi:MAG: TIGR03790 family protein [Deltaproteobacteria bacterium]|nr:TIGR03790 family protein [Deltaproteobacteria bacterium]
MASLILFTACSAERHPEIVVVVNDASPISVAIGERYAATRGIPAENVVALTIPILDPSLADDSHETMLREDFDEKVRKPLETILIEQDLADTIEIIVTTKGVPLRVEGTSGPMKTLLRDSIRSSLDAELSLLFSDLIGSAGVSKSVNPFFDSSQSFREFRRTHPESPIRYMVARLTGYPDEVRIETREVADR